MNTRWLGLALLSFLLFLNGTTSPGVAADPATKPPKVQVSQPLVQEITDYQDFTGRVEATQSVDLRARVTGYLVKIDYKPGTVVQKGDVLFEIDARPYEAALDAANAGIALAAARLKLAKANLDRTKALMQRTPGAISPDELNKLTADAEEAAAAVKAAKAHSETYKLNLAFTKITAPITGKIGRPLLDVGNLVNQDVTLLAKLYSTDPVYVYFHVDERSYKHLTQLYAEGKRKGDNEKQLPVQMGVTSDEGFPRLGKIDFVGVEVNPNSGSVLWRAVFANPDGLLLPGMFARVRLRTSAPHKALLVSVGAVRYDGVQNYVGVVSDKNVLEQRGVKVGDLQDGLRVVTEGLKPEDWVVVSWPGPRPRNPKEKIAALEFGKKVTPEKIEMPGAPKEKTKPDK